MHLDKGNKCYLRVTQTLNRIKNYGIMKDRETLLEIGYPKTPHSIRNIPLLPEIAERLRQYKEQQALYNSMNGIQPNGYVFTNRAGNWIDPRDFQRDFKLTLKRCGIREINVHGGFYNNKLRCIGIAPMHRRKIFSKLTGQVDR